MTSTTEDRAGFLYVGVGAVFLASRICYYLVGVRFDASVLYYGWQYLDVNLLRDRLIESVMNSHSQPPLFNLFLGLVVKFQPAHLAQAFHTVFLGLGLVMALALVALMQGLGLPRTYSVLLTLLYMVSPTTVLYEHVLLPEYPVASLLCVASLLLLWWMRGTTELSHPAEPLSENALSGGRNSLQEIPSPGPPSSRTAMANGHSQARKSKPHLTGERWMVRTNQYLKSFRKGVWGTTLLQNHHDSERSQPSMKVSSRHPENPRHGQHHPMFQKFSEGGAGDNPFSKGFPTEDFLIKGFLRKTFTGTLGIVRLPLVAAENARWSRLPWSSIFILAWDSVRSWGSCTEPHRTQVLRSAVSHRQRGLGIGVLFFLTLAVVVLTKSVFQLVWLVAACAWLIAGARLRWKSVVLAPVVPMMLVLGWQVWTSHRFGVWVTSSWLGMNLSRNTVERLPAEEKMKLIRDGHLSAMAMLPAFSDFDAYRGTVPEPRLTQIPALDQEWKRPPSFGVNFNYVGYIDVSRARLRDAIFVIQDRPGRFARNVLDAVTVYATPAGQYLSGTANADKLGFLSYLAGKQSPDARSFSWRGAVVLAWYVIAICYGAYAAGLFRRGPSLGRVRPAVIGFMWMTILYVTAVANLSEIWENNRIRFMVDPLAWVIAGAALHQFGAQWVRGRSGEQVGERR
ncbi:MAG: hypothetical protein AB1646_08210 [Thermodesulfobacteriota bacterium]